MMLLLTKYLVGKEGDGKEWYAGQQLGALRHYLSDDVEILADYMEDDWQGDVYALLRVFVDGKSKFILWRDSFGSCSGCDGLEGEDGYEYIKATLAEGNTRQFDTLDDVVKYGNESEDYWWRDAPILALVSDARMRLTIRSDEVSSKNVSIDGNRDATEECPLRLPYFSSCTVCALRASLRYKDVPAGRRMKS